MLALKVSAEVFVAAAMALSLAYALEYPGKMQLDRSTYVAIQRIYDPAFTLGRAISESLGVILTFALLLMTPSGVFLAYSHASGLLDDHVSSRQILDP
jgi:hypothetical protein